MASRSDDPQTRMHLEALHLFLRDQLRAEGEGAPNIEFLRHAVRALADYLEPRSRLTLDRAFSSARGKAGGNRRTELAKMLRVRDLLQEGFDFPDIVSALKADDPHSTEKPGELRRIFDGYVGEIEQFESDRWVRTNVRDLIDGWDIADPDITHSQAR